MVAKIESLAILSAAWRGRSARARASRYRSATALAGGLAATLLLAVPAAAQSTQGGDGGRGDSLPGPAGGTSSNTGAGQDGQSGGDAFAGGAGGGAGATGGHGGAATGPVAGGAGGATPGADGQAGATTPISSYYASGGGGGAHGAVLVTTVTPATPISGGRGGDGADANGGDGGGGGAGGYGIVVDTTGSFIFANTINGGDGGDGGNGYFYGGSGGDGGHGLLFTGAATATINAAVTGGNGGDRGIILSGFGDPGELGAGGSGIVGNDLALTLNAAVSGGMSGATRAYALRLGGASSLTLGTGWSLTGGIDIASGTLTFDQDSDASLSSAISGAGSLLKAGTGTLTLGAANSYGGTTTIDGGTLELDALGSLGSGGVAINNGTLRSSSTRTISNAISFGALTTPSVEVADGETLTLSGGLGFHADVMTFGAAGGTGIIVLQTSTPAFNTDGQMVVAGGTLRGAGDFGVVSSGFRSITVDSGATLDFNGSDGQVRELLGSGTLSNDDGTTTISSGDFGGTVVGTQGLVLDHTVFGTAGTLTLGGDNSYSGGTILNRGTLALAHDSGAGTGAITIGAAATLASSGATRVIDNNLVSSAGVGTAATIASAGTFGLGGVLSGGAFAFTTADAGSADIERIELRAANSYGATSIGAGVALIVTGDGTLGTGGVTIAADGYLGFESLSAPSTVARAITGGGRIVADTDDLILSGANTHTGGTQVLGGILRLGEHHAFGTGTLIVDGGIVDLDGFVQMSANLSGTGGTITNLRADTISQLTIYGGVDDGVYDGVIEDGDGGVLLVKDGSASTRLNGANSYTGGTTLTDGELIAGSTSAFGTGAFVQFGGTLTVATGVELEMGAFDQRGGTFDLNGEQALVASLTGSAGTITNGGTLIVDGGETTYAGVIEDGSGVTTLRLQDGADLTLTGSNSFTGYLDIYDSTLTLGHDEAAGGSGNIIYTAGDLATIRFADGIVNASGIDLDAADTQLFVGADESAEQSGEITSCYCAGFTKTGDGTLILSGFNSHTGTTSILGGTLAVTLGGVVASELIEIGNGARLEALEDAAAGGDMTILASGGTIDSGDYTFLVGGSADFQGELTKTGSGTLVLLDMFEEGTGAGGIDVTAGTLALGTDYAAGTGIIKLADGTSLMNAGCDCLWIGNDIQVADGGTATIDGFGMSTSLGGSISGGNVHFFTDPGTDPDPYASSFELAGANSYGDTLIGANVAVILTEGTLGEGDVVFDDVPSHADYPAALVFANTANYSYAGTIIGAGLVSIETDDPSATITLTGSNTATANFTGTVDVVSGKLVIDGAFGDVINNSATMNLDGYGASFGGTGTFHGSLDLSAATLNPGNSPGTLNIAGNLVLGGGTVLNFELGEPGAVGGANNDLINVGGDLRLDGTLNTIAWGAGYGTGYYRLFNYGGTLSGPGVTIGSIAEGLDATVSTDINGQVNLRLGAPQIVQYWDGTDLTGTSAAATGNGGSSTWNATRTNWTAPTGYAINDSWQGQAAAFAGAAGGTVTVEGTQAFEELRFETDGYLLRPADGSARLTTTGGFSIIGVDAGITADIGVVIEGAAGITKTGDGTLLLSTGNSYTGATEITDGTLRLGTSSALAATTAVTVSAGATFDLDGFQTQVGSLAGAGSVTLGAAQLNVGSDNSSTVFNGTLSGIDGSGATLTKMGSGTLTLGGTVTLATSGTASTNMIKVDAGTLAVSGTGDVTADILQSFATIENAGTITAPIVQSFGTVTNTGTIVGTTQSFSTFDNYGAMGSLQLLGGIGTNHATGTINGDAQAFTTFTSTGIINGNISNFSTTLIENQVNGSVANLTAGATITLTGAVSGITYYQGVEGAALDLAGFNTALGALVGAGAVELGAATLTVGDATSFGSFTGVIGGSGGLVKTGSSTQALAGVNSYAGPTAVNAGTLEIADGGAITSEVTIASGATFSNNGTVTGALVNDGVLTSSGIVNAVSPVTLRNNAGAIASARGQMNGVVENAGTFNVTWELTGITRFEQVAGGALNLGFDAVALGALNGAGTVELGSGTLSLGQGDLSSTFDGQISGLGGITKLGSGDLNLNGANGYTGQTLVSDGTLRVGGSGALAGEVVNNASFVSTGTLTGGLTNSGTALVRGELSGPVQNLGGSITLTGLTTGIGGVEQAAGALFDLGGFDTEFGSLNGSGTVSLGNAMLTTGGNDGDTSFAGVLTGGASGALTKAGTGTLTLTGASSYGGGTTIDGGTLLLGDGGAIGAGEVTNNAVFGFDGSIDTSFGNVISGSGSLIKAGSHVVTLTQANSYSGGTLVTAGVLALADNSAAGSGAITLADGTTLRNAGGVLSLSNDIAIGGTASLDATGASITVLEGTLSGGTAQFTGSGMFVLNAANSYTDTVIGANTALVVADGTLGSGNLAFEDAPSDPLTPATLLFSGSADHSYGGTISGGGFVVVDAAPGFTLTLSGSNDAGLNFTGGVVVASGELVIDGDFGDVVNDSASLTLDGSGPGGASLGGSGTFHGSMTVGDATLAPGNSPGTLTIAGDLTLGGGTILDYELGESGVAGGANNDLIVVGGNLTLDGTLNVTALPTFGAGYYRLFDYGGTLTDNGLAFGALPTGYSSTLLTNIDGQVNMLFQDSPQIIQYWDGTDISGASAAAGGDGGAGNWTTASTNWTAPTGFGVNDAWAGQVGVFGGPTGGTVTIFGIQAFQELRFVTDGYVLAGSAAADGLATTGGFSVVDVGGGLTAAIDATISGTGGLTKTGTGNLTLGGANSYSGVTTVAEGALTIAASGSLAGAVINDATLDNFGTIAGVVTNNGALTSGGVLGGLANSGSASISGQLNGAVSNGGAITLTGTTTGIGAVTQDAAGSFALNGFATSFGSLAGSGAIDLGTATLTTNGNGGSTSFAGVISGTGGLTKAGAGTLTLTGAADYTGTTTIAEGTLALSAAISLAGDVLNQAGFDNAGTVGGLVENQGSLTSTGTLGGLVNQGGASVRGQLNGDVANGGTLTLTGITTSIRAYTGGAGSTFALGGFATEIGSLAGEGGVTLGSATLTLGGNDGTTAFSGAISGSGRVVKTGSGTLTLDGANSYSGVTTVAEGTLAVGEDGALASGGVRNEAAFVNAGIVGGPLANIAGAVASNSGTLGGGAVNDGTFASAGTIEQGLVNSGTASLEGRLNGTLRNDAGTVTLTGTLTGVTLLTQEDGAELDLAGFDLSLGSFSGAGAIQLGAATLTTGSDGQNRLFSGSISGSGGLAKTGGGALVLTGANSYAGTTTIEAGVVQLGNGATDGTIGGGAVINNGILAINRSDAATLSNAISGTGSFIQLGTGTTTLTGTNSYGGGTLVSAGRLRGDAGSLQGDIDNDGVLEFAQGGAGIFAGRLSGAGALEKTGAGSLDLTGDSAAFTGATRILGGQLLVNGLLSGSTVLVESGATLGGAGVVGGFVARGGSTISPGNSVGTLGVDGNVEFQAGSLFAVEVQPSGADRIEARGTAQLDGTLAITNLGGSYAVNSMFVLLDADGGRTGTFELTTGLSGFGAAYRPTIVYTANQVQLVLAPNQLSALLGTTPVTGNQGSTASRIDAALLAGWDPAALDALFALAPAEMPAALDALSGEAYASATRAALEDERLVREAALGRAREAADRGESGAGGWAQIVGSWGGADADGNAADYDIDHSGFLLGIDTGSATEEGSWRAGVMGHHILTTTAVSGRGRVELEQDGVGVYAGLASGGLRARIGASLSRLDLTANRQIHFAGFADSARGRTQGSMVQSFGELGYRLETGAHSFVEPYVTGSITRVRFDAFREGNGAAALAVAEQDATLGIAVLGMRGQTEVRDSKGRGIRLGGNIGLRHAFGDRAGEPVIALAAAPAEGFALRSAEIDRYAMTGNIDVSVAASEALSLSLGYTGVHGAKARDHGLRLGLSLRF